VERMLVAAEDCRCRKLGNFHWVTSIAQAATPGWLLGSRLSFGGPASKVVCLAQPSRAQGSGLSRFAAERPRWVRQLLRSWTTAGVLWCSHEKCARK
jgi:hypothetical protein